MTLTEFLLARIAEDEAAARAATTRGGSAIYTDARRGGKQAVLEHVARHAPGRVLAECEAKRRIVERCRAADATDPKTSWIAAQEGAAEQDVLALLALPYADHPDYDETWRP